MQQTASPIEAVWAGPYRWPMPKSQSNLPPLPAVPGVYLQTVEYQDGYLTYAAGRTRRLIPTRFREHTMRYMHGDYNVLDIAAMQQGVRKVIWRGWGWSPEKRAEFEERRAVILDAARAQLAGFRVFVANVGNGERIHERLEASIMNNLYQQPSPFCDVPDRRMHLAKRWPSESPVIVKSSCMCLLHGIPLCLEI